VHLDDTVALANSTDIALYLAELARGQAGAFSTCRALNMHNWFKVMDAPGGRWKRNLKPNFCTGEI